jgi:ADP-ribosylation factor-binding protein GGA
MCEEESDDAEAVAKLLEINDSIHRTIQRYKLMKAGNVAEANKIEKGTLGTSTGVGKNAANELSLIDFDPDPPALNAPAAEAANGSLLDAVGPSTTAPAAHASVEDDLLGLSLDSGPSGMISLGPSSTSSAPAPLPFSLSPQPSARLPSPMTSPPLHQQSKPNYDAFAALTSALPSSKPATPNPMQQQQRPTTQAPHDPYASLVPSSNSRPSTPSQNRNVSQPHGQQPSLMSISQNRTASPAFGNQGPAAGDDEWNFASSLPDAPQSHTVRVHSSQILLEFAAQRQQGQSGIAIQARFSNNTSQPITALHFQVAVEKSYSLNLQPQTGRILGPNQKNGVQQEILLSGVPPGKGGVVKMRFKMSFQSQGQTYDEQGDVPSLGIA